MNSSTSSARPRIAAARSGVNTGHVQEVRAMGRLQRWSRRTRRPAAAAAVVLALTLGTVTTAIAASGDSVTGFGRIVVGEAVANVNLNARLDASGMASGTVRFDMTARDEDHPHELSAVADVVCVNVQGNRAHVRAVIRDEIPNPHDPGTVYKTVGVLVTDEGSPGVGNDRLNVTLTWAVPEATPSTSCGGLGSGGLLVAGNLRVSDATG